MIEDCIFSVLSSAPELQEYNAGGVYPILAPQKKTGWHLTYQQISEPEPIDDEAPREARWQINVVPPHGYGSPSYRAAKQGAKAVQDVLKNFTGGAEFGVCIEQIRFENQADVNDQSTETFFVAQDYIIKYFEV